jgi:hypothetical protein
LKKLEKKALLPLKYWIIKRIQTINQIYNNNKICANFNQVSVKNKNQLIMMMLRRMSKNITLKIQILHLTKEIMIKIII